MEAVLNADEITNGPTPGNHFRVISSATELLRVIFFQLPSQKTWVVSYHVTVVFGEGTLKSTRTSAPGYSIQPLIKPNFGLYLAIYLLFNGIPFLCQKPNITSQCPYCVQSHPRSQIGSKNWNSSPCRELGGALFSIQTFQNFP